MANVLPLILLGGAAAFLLTKKKKEKLPGSSCYSIGPEPTREKNKQGIVCSPGTEEWYQPAMSGTAKQIQKIQEGFPAIASWSIKYNEDEELWKRGHPYLWDWRADVTEGYFGEGTAQSYEEAMNAIENYFQQTGYETIETVS